ncbi:hypothetical protein K435DRAFT_968261 [Dendrothele bispora CBS 962.96]|uniref:Uncharacterized protein n=1 Tax=Dendrothele bispora (strain CBS 962.96) TaxID=1314807 RepID=A0A4S8LQ61_DENBC|nr:hypothetical protein K435DRAFT_968261 [Dendrothele bispora CBS 962.96]
MPPQRTTPQPQAAAQNPDHEKLVEELASLRAFYIYELERINFPMRSNLKLMSETHAKYAAKASTTVPNFTNDPQGREVYKQEMIRLSKKELNTFDDRIEAAAAISWLSSDLDVQIGDLPEHARDQIFGRCNNHCENHKLALPNEAWAPPTWSPHETPMLFPPEPGMEKLDRAQIGKIARKRAFEYEEELKAAQGQHLYQGRLQSNNLDDTNVPSSSSFPKVTNTQLFASFVEEVKNITRYRFGVGPSLDPLEVRGFEMIDVDVRADPKLPLQTARVMHFHVETLDGKMLIPEDELTEMLEDSYILAHPEAS